MKSVTLFDTIALFDNPTLKLYIQYCANVFGWCGMKRNQYLVWHHLSLSKQPQQFFSKKFTGSCFFFWLFLWMWSVWSMWGDLGSVAAAPSHPEPFPLEAVGASQWTLADAFLLGVAWWVTPALKFSTALYVTRLQIWKRHAWTHHEIWLNTWWASNSRGSGRGGVCMRTDNAQYIRQCDCVWSVLLHLQAILENSSVSHKESLHDGVKEQLLTWLCIVLHTIETQTAKWKLVCSDEESVFLLVMCLPKHHGNSKKLQHQNSFCAPHWFGSTRPDLKAAVSLQWSGCAPLIWPSISD